jgi:hypothetical protein
MIEELSPEQRWIFIGILLLAGDSDIPGVVYRRKDENGEPVGHRGPVLADTLGVDESSIEPALARMVEKGKVRVDARGVISVCNWSKYQSEYERKKVGRIKVRPDDGQKSAVDLDLDREREREEEATLRFDHEAREWRGVSKKDIDGWAEAFPACDIRIELAKAREWLLGAGPRGQKRAWRKFITGWLERSQAAGGTRGKFIPSVESRVGKSTYQPTAEERLGYRKSFEKELRKNTRDEAEIAKALAEWDRKNLVRGKP